MTRREKEIRPDESIQKVGRRSSAGANATNDRAKFAHARKWIVVDLNDEIITSAITRTTNVAVRDK